MFKVNNKDKRTTPVVFELKLFYLLEFCEDKPFLRRNLHNRLPTAS